MISAICETAESGDNDLDHNRSSTAEYLEACNFLFEQGILSHSSINSEDSAVLKNMKKGYDYFQEELKQSGT